MIEVDGEWVRWGYFNATLVETAIYDFRLLRCPIELCQPRSRNG
jgi:hypothetical protein